MVSKKRYFGRAIASFLLVLFTMPLGHAMMILMEHIMDPGPLHVAGFLLGLAGLIIAVAGIFVRGDLRQTLFGFFGGLLFWTGWVEFLFQYYADRYGMLPMPDPMGGRPTQPEYLIMPASFGFLVMFWLLYIFSTRSGCLFFSWIQRHLFPKGNTELANLRPMTRHTSLTTFMEFNVMIWTSYVTLMFCYDTNFLGVSHPITLALGVVCLAGSVYMFLKQTRMKSWGANIRMSIATVLVFWTFVEIIGRLGILHEIWLQPLDHIWEMVALGLLFVALAGYTLYDAFKVRS